MINAMSRLRRVLWAAILTTLLVFGAIADHALLEQARLARRAALTEAIAEPDIGFPNQIRSCPLDVKRQFQLAVVRWQ